MAKAKASQELTKTRRPRNGMASATLRLRITAAAESILRAGHPWLYADSIRSQNRSGDAGELAVVYDRSDRFLAVGLYDPDSVIRVRILHSGKPLLIDGTFWRERLAQAVQIRRALFDAHTTGFRLINGESDGWPGLVLDRYDSTLVLKLYTAAWVPWLKPVLETICAQLAPLRVVLRLSRNIQQFVARQFARRDGEVVHGPALSGPVHFLETRLLFEADVQHGQKTGFFLDQRENRRRVESLAAGRTMLNAFSFSGGFSLYAARAGARAVLDLDISAHALASAKRNFALNLTDPAVGACAHQQVRADAFDWLVDNRGRKFDLIVLDPPSLARRESERAAAIHAYGRLVASATKHLEPNGILVSCSCSAQVSDAEFFEAVRSAAATHQPGYSELAIAGQPADHPASFPEAKYLKAIYLKFN
jgi:23S rRNA (cytosine1962-C5)-methyltransferase